MFRAMINKEFRLVFRDKQALMALFVMPAIFIIIMSVAMKDQFSTKNIEFSLFVKDADKSEMTQAIVHALNVDTKFQILSSKEDAAFMVKFPKRYEADAKKKVKITLLDAIQNNQLQAFKAMLSEHILRARFDVMAENVKKHSLKASRSLKELKISTDALFKVKYASLKKVPNATQQSVPAWIVFGMFFIIIPMSTIYINERKQNTLTRLNSMNVSIFAMTLSKSIPYLVINQIQVWIMIAVGMFIVPFFDSTPALAINGSFGAVVLISMALSIAAIGVSTLIAVSASSSEQATTIGGIFNILLGAIGGVMVPKFIMPESMQRLAELSPMGWGLDGFLKIFLNAGDAMMVLGDASKLFSFGLVLLLLSMLVLKLRINRGL